MEPKKVSSSVSIDLDQGVQAMDRGTDRALMDRVSAGDRNAYRVLLERYWTQLTTYATSITADKDLAEDVVQETFVRIWSQRRDWTASGSASAYLYRITRNLALNARRDLRAEHDRRERGGGRAVSSAAGVDPHEELAAQSLRKEIEAAISLLPDRRREAFVLSRFHGLSYQEVAETMGISTQTVANQMRAALAQLRIALARHLKDEG